MADDAGNLSEEDKATVKAFLEAKWPQPRLCEVCGTNNWVITHHIVGTRVYDVKHIFGGISYPHVLVVCTNCTNTKQFNAAMMGIKEPIKQEEKK